MAGHRLFFPFRDMPTLIWIKKKEGIFCTRGSLVVSSNRVNKGPVARNLTMTKRFFVACREAIQCRRP
jgi:hypothetical protein